MCSVEAPDVVLVAGDVVNEGRWSEAGYLNAVASLCKPKHYIGVFGNDDYEQFRPRIRSLAKAVTWLEDEVTVVEVGGVTLSILGSSGVLDEPTPWQRRNVPIVEERYAKRVELVKKFCEEAGGLKVLLTHYAPTFVTLEGEPRWAWRQMGSRRVEEIMVSRCGFLLAIHGHAHNSRRLEATLGRVKVYNVAFPARRGVALIKVERAVGLEAYLKREALDEGGAGQGAGIKAGGAMQG